MMMTTTTMMMTRSNDDNRRNNHVSSSISSYASISEVLYDPVGGNGNTNGHLREIYDIEAAAPYDEMAALLLGTNGTSNIGPNINHDSDGTAASMTTTCPILRQPPTPTPRPRPRPAAVPQFVAVYSHEQQRQME
jgi:hypothetical protein